MKLGAITSLWAYAEGLSISASLKRIAALGLCHVDILGILHGDPRSLADSETAKIRSCIRDLDLVFGSLILIPPGNIASIDDNEREECWEYVKAGIDQAAYWGGTQVLCNAGQRAFGTPHPQSWATSVEFLSRASRYAREKGIFLTIEAEPYVHYLVNDLDTTLRMVEAVDHPNCMAVLDVGHLNLSRDAPLGLVPIKKWTMRVHLSENNGLLHANDILGTGTVDFQSYLNAFEQMEFGQVCKEKEMDFVAVMELGVLGQPIPDPDFFATRSLDNLLKMAPFLDIA